MTFEAVQGKQVITAEGGLDVESQGLHLDPARMLPRCVSLSKALNLTDPPSFNYEIKLTLL